MDSQSDGESAGRLLLRMNQIFCVVTVASRRVAAMIGRGRCRECDGFIRLAF